MINIGLTAGLGIRKASSHMLSNFFLRRSFNKKRIQFGKLAYDSTQISSCHVQQESSWQTNWYNNYAAEFHTIGIYGLEGLKHNLGYCAL